MKRTVKIVLLVLVLALALVCASCGIDGLFSPRTEKNSGEYTIQVSLLGGTGIVAEDFVSGTKLVKPTKDPTRTGYTFTGWFADRACEEAFTFGITLKAGEKYVIYAGWTAKTPEATFVFGAGIEDAVVEAEEGKFIPPTAERTGYELTAWYVDSGLSTEADFDEVAVDGKTFYAGWSAIRYTITYDYGGVASQGAGTVRSYTVEDSFDLVAPAQSSVESGYVFLYWENEQHERQNAITSGTTGNKTFTAVYVSHNAFIDSVTGGKIVGLTVNIGVRNSVSGIDLYSVLTPSPYATIEVFDGEEKLTAGTPVALSVGTKVFTAKVTSQYGEEENTYTLNVTRYDANDVVVTFHYPDATTDEEHVAKGDTVEAPTAKSIAGKTFANWYQEAGYANIFDFNADIIVDTDVYAKYDLIEYEITYCYGIGSAPDVQITAFDVDHRADMLDAVAPTGYAFSRYTDADGLDVPYIEIGTHEDVVLYAHYVKTGSSFMTAAYTDTDQEISSDDLVSYFSWAVAYRHPTVTFTFSDQCTAEVFDGILSQITVLNSYVHVGYSYSQNAQNYIVGTVTATFTYVEPSEVAAVEDSYSQLPYYTHEATPASTRANDFNAFAIDFIDTYVSVKNSDQLVYATMMGYRPLPQTGSAAEEMYAAARAVLREIVDDAMTDVEKAHVIFDWLVENVVYDQALLDMSTDNVHPKTTEELKVYKGFYLEGVFTDRRAVCDGISKAYALMCNIEGIRCVQVSGKIVETNGGHAWNKVYLDGNWYVVDATHGDTHIGDYEVMNHSYFLMTDAQRAATATPDDYTELVANDDYNYYTDVVYTVDGHKYDLSIDNRAELHAACVYLAQLVAAHGRNFTLDMRMNYTYANIATELSDAMTGSGFYGSYSRSGGERNGDVLILIIPE